MEKKTKLTSKGLVTQANTLISAHYEMTDLERKIILASMSILKPSDESFYIIRFGLDELCTLLGISSSNSASIKRAAKDLASRVVSIEEGKNWTITHWVREVSCKDKVVEIIFNDTLQPYLLRLKQSFTTIPVVDLIRIKGKYGSRLYELLFQQLKFGKREFEISELRQILGVAPEEYPLFKDFREKVIEKPIEEIHKGSNMCIEFTLRRTGRPYTHVTFKFKIKETKMDVSLPGIIELTTMDAFIGILGKSAALLAVERYGLEYCLANLQYVYEQKPRSKKSYLKKSLQDNYAEYKAIPPPSLFAAEDMPCERCHGTGWCERDDGGNKTVYPCDCKKKE